MQPSLDPIAGATGRRTLTRKQGVMLIVAGSLMAWALAVPSRPSYAIKSLIDQAQDQGYTDGMIQEIVSLFPDSRALWKARQLSQPAHPLATQALTDYDRKALEDRLYESALQRLTVEGMDVATLLVSWVGQMRFKVVLSVRTKELTYPDIRELHKRIRTILEKEVLAESFKGFELAELSSFTVLNRRNGRYYEYPVLYQNVSVPLYGEPGDEALDLIQRKNPGLPPEGLPLDRSKPRQFPWGKRPWEANEAKDKKPAPAAEPEAKASAKPSQHGALPPSGRGGYTDQDFYGAPPATLGTGAKSSPGH